MALFDENPNNALAQYITNLPRRIRLSGVLEYGLTEIHYPHDWYNVRNARLTVEHDGNVETDAYFDDGYYHSPKALATTLNGDKPERVKFSYEPVSHKFVAHVKSETNFTLYGDLPGRQQRQCRVIGSFDVCTSLLHRRFEA